MRDDVWSRLLSLSLSLCLAKKKGTTTLSFPLFSRRRLLGSDKVSRKSPREEEDNAQKGEVCFVLVKSKFVKRCSKEKKREGLRLRFDWRRDSVRFRVFFLV